MARGVRNPRKLRDPDIPLYTPETFLDALVRLIVADDQVSLNTLFSNHISRLRL
jgi:hypothetical protein